jgi:hypothetical protein
VRGNLAGAAGSEIGIAEIVGTGIDMQVLIGRRETVVVFITPHSADVGADFEAVEAQSPLRERFSDCDARGAGANDADVS